MIIDLKFKTEKEAKEWLNSIDEFIASNGLQRANSHRRTITWISDREENSYIPLLNPKSEICKLKYLRIKVDIVYKKHRFVVFTSPKVYKLPNKCYVPSEIAYNYITSRLIDDNVMNYALLDGNIISDVCPDPFGQVMGGIPTYIAETILPHLSHRMNVLNERLVQSADCNFKCNNVGEFLGHLSNYKSASMVLNHCEFVRVRGGYNYWRHLFDHWRNLDDIYSPQPPPTDTLIRCSGGRTLNPNNISGVVRSNWSDNASTPISEAYQNRSWREIVANNPEIDLEAILRLMHTTESLERDPLP